MKTTFQEQANVLRRALLPAICDQFDRLKDEEGDIRFEDYIDINVCNEVDKELDVRIIRISEIAKGGARDVYAVIDVVEQEEMKPIEELTIDTLLDIHAALSEMEGK